MNSPVLDSKSDIERIADVILRQSKSYDKFPTPVNNIVSYAELTINTNIDLSKVHSNFFIDNFGFLDSALRKIIGLIDLRQKTVYLDLNQKEPRQNFVKLHEVGHKVLPWQEETLCYLDDEQTLDPSVTQVFEREASFFASLALFQSGRYAEHASSLPLSINSPMLLAKKFGSSNQASIRKYIETSKKRCAVLVFEKGTTNDPFKAKIRNYFQSLSFQEHFGDISWPNECGLKFPFIVDLKIGKRFHTNGILNVLRNGVETISFSYHYFNNGYNTFVFLFPTGERINSRTTIIVRP